MVLKKVVVTGASGTVGGYLLSLLKERRITAVPISRRRSAKTIGKWFFWDLRRWRSVSQLKQKLGRVDALFHLGALVPGASGKKISRAALMDGNVRACLCLGQWALETNTPLVYLSTGDRSVGGFYGTSKWLGEEVLEHLRAQGLRLVVLRPSSIYGRGMAQNKMLSRFLKNAVSDGVLNVYPPPDRVDLIYAGDVAAAILSAVEKEAWGTFNIAGGKLYSVTDIAEACVRAAGKGTVKKHRAHALRLAEKRFAFSSGPARRAFGFRPKYDLEKGLLDMMRGVPQ